MTTAWDGLIIYLTSLFFSSSSLNVQKMKQLKMNMSEANLKVLQHFALIEIDKKGSVRLLMWGTSIIENCWLSFKVSGRTVLMGKNYIGCSRLEEILCLVSTQLNSLCAFLLVVLVMVTIPVIFKLYCPFFIYKLTCFQCLNRWTNGYLCAYYNVCNNYLTYCCRKLHE